MLIGYGADNQGWVVGWMYRGGHGGQCSGGIELKVVVSRITKGVCSWD